MKYSYYFLLLLLCLVSCAKEELLEPASPTAQLAVSPSCVAHPVVESCQCTRYVKRKLGFEVSASVEPQAFANYLVANANWTKQTITATNAPRVRDVIVYSPGYLGTNASIGHIGLVSNIAGWNFSTNRKLEVKSANMQTGDAIAAPECGCTNVGVTGITTKWNGSSFDLSKVSFYRAASYPPVCP